VDWDTDVLGFFLSCVMQVIEHSLALTAFNLVINLIKQILSETVLVFRYDTALMVLELSSFWMPDPFPTHFKNHTCDS